MSSGERILVSGVNGFVGTALCQILLDKGHFVRGTVRSKDKIPLVSGNADFYVTGDIGPDTAWDSALKDIDVIVHLAGITHKKLTSGEDYYNVNTYATVRLAEEAVKHNVPRLIYISSVKVNGESNRQDSDGNIIRFTEEDKPNPSDHYAISKWRAEEALYKISAESGLEIIILRPALIYGPGVKANFLSLLKLIDSGIPLPFANIKNHRSFIYLGNLVDIISRFITESEVTGQTYLVSDGVDISTLDLVHRIAKAMGRKPLLVPFPVEVLRFLGKVAGRLEAIERLTQSLIVDNRKIVQKLKWTPFYSLDEGIKQTVDYYLDNA